MENYPRKTFKHAVVAVDVVIFSVINEKLNVLLIQLKEKPFNGKWALPGGLVTQGESMEDAVRRHLLEKAGVTDLYTEQLYTFGNPSRDPNGWVVSVSYMALVSKQRIIPKTLARYTDIKWHEVGKLPSTAYDHFEIIQTGVERLRAKLTYTNIIYSLMNPEFTLTELQKMYESVLGEKLDKRNFRKKILTLKLLKKLNKQKKGDQARPAQLYCFIDRTPKIIEVL